MLKRVDNRILELVAEGYDELAVAGEVNVHPSEISRWLRLGLEDMNQEKKYGDEDHQTYGTFFLRYHKASGQFRQILKQAIIEDGDWRGYSWILTKQFPDLYGDKKTIEIRNQNEMTDEQKRLVLQKLPFNALERLVNEEISLQQLLEEENLTNIIDADFKQLPSS